jgi:hypothetical protein
MMELRTKIAVTLLVILQLCAWLFSLAGNFGIHFWNRSYALECVRNQPPIPFHNSTAFRAVQESYFTWRYVWLFPHIVGATLWWNLYYLQLLPSVRRQYSGALHRWLGRFLLVAASLQVASGAALACTSHSSMIKMVSLTFGTAVGYCIVQTWQYAVARDVKRHRHWALRLVGYLQVIAAQRLWLVLLVGTHQLGWTFLYPSLDGDDVTQELVDSVLMDMFDGSFVLAALTGTYVTEWYLAGLEGYLDAPTASSSLEDEKMQRWRKLHPESEYQPLNDVQPKKEAGN